MKQLSNWTKVSDGQYIRTNSNGATKAIVQMEVEGWSASALDLNNKIKVINTRMRVLVDAQKQADDFLKDNGYVIPETTTKAIWKAHSADHFCLTHDHDTLAEVMRNVDKLDGTWTVHVQVKPYFSSYTCKTLEEAVSAVTSRLDSRCEITNKVSDLEVVIGKSFPDEVAAKQFVDQTLASKGYTNIMAKLKHWEQHKETSTHVRMDDNGSIVAQLLQDSSTGMWVAKVNGEKRGIRHRSLSQAKYLVDQYLACAQYTLDRPMYQLTAWQKLAENTYERLTMDGCIQVCVKLVGSDWCVISGELVELNKATTLNEAQRLADNYVKDKGYTLEAGDTHASETPKTDETTSIKVPSSTPLGAWRKATDTCYKRCGQHDIAMVRVTQNKNGSWSAHINSLDENTQTHMSHPHGSLNEAQLYADIYAQQKGYTLEAPMVSDDMKLKAWDYVTGSFCRANVLGTKIAVITSTSDSWKIRVNGEELIECPKTSDEAQTIADKYLADEGYQFMEQEQIHTMFGQWNATTIPDKYIRDCADGNVVSIDTVGDKWQVNSTLAKSRPTFDTLTEAVLYADGLVVNEGYKQPPVNDALRGQQFGAWQKNSIDIHYIQKDKMEVTIALCADNRWDVRYCIDKLNTQHVFKFKTVEDAKYYVECWLSENGCIIAASNTKSHADKIKEDTVNVVQNTVKNQASTTLGAWQKNDSFWFRHYMYAVPDAARIIPTADGMWYISVQNPQGLHYMYDIRPIYKTLDQAKQAADIMLANLEENMKNGWRQNDTGDTFLFQTGEHVATILHHDHGYHASLPNESSFKFSYTFATFKAAQEAMDLYFRRIDVPVLGDWIKADYSLLYVRKHQNKNIAVIQYKDNRYCAHISSTTSDGILVEFAQACTKLGQAQALVDLFLQNLGFDVTSELDKQFGRWTRVDTQSPIIVMRKNAVTKAAARIHWDEAKEMWCLIVNGTEMDCYSKLDLAQYAADFALGGQLQVETVKPMEPTLVTKAIEAVKVDATDAAWRTAGSQLVKLTRAPLVGLLQRHLAPGDDGFRTKLASFLDTELGAGLLAGVLSQAPVPERLAKELRVKAMADSLDCLVDVVVEPLRQVVVIYLQDVPAPAVATPAVLQPASFETAVDNEEDVVIQHNS